MTERDAETRVMYDFKSPVVLMAGLEKARLLIGRYIGIPSADGADIFDLYRMDGAGEPTGQCQGQMGGTIVDAPPEAGEAR